MSFGWSATDIVSFAKLCYDIYSFCGNAPVELQDLSDRLDGLGRKLTRLSYILEQSGLEHWRAASTLEKDLLDVQAYLEPLRSATNNATSVSSKAKGLGKYALNQDKIRQMERNLVHREREIDDMKIDIILVCSLRNLRYGHDHIQRASNPNSTPENGNKDNGLLEALPHVAMLTSATAGSDPTGPPSRSISNASRALATAVSLRSRHSAVLEIPGDYESVSEGSVYSSQMAHDFVAEIASLAEQQELYSGNVDHSRNLKLLNGIADTATQFHLVRPSSQSTSSTSSAAYQLPQVCDLNHPDSFGQAMFDQLSSASDSASLRLWAEAQYHKAASELSQQSVDDSASSLRDPPELASPSQMVLQNNIPVEDEILPIQTASISFPVLPEDDNLTQSERLNLEGWSRVKRDASSRTAMSCSYEIATSPGSLVVICIPDEGMRGHQETVSTPGTHPATSDSLVRRRPRVVRHCLQPQSRTIPHLLHPDVEGPIGEPKAPYTLSFTERQWISVEGASEGLRRTSSLKYIFEKQIDRIHLCERIFGKALVMSAGSNRISLGDREISHLSAISLWLDAAGEILSITFLNNLGNKRAAPKDEEWRVYSVWSRDKASRHQATLALTVGSMSEPDESVDPSDVSAKPRDVGTKGSVFKKKRSASAARSDVPTLLKCTIEFTHASDRAVFATHVPP